MHDTLALNPPILMKRHLILRWKFNLKVLWILSFAIIGFLLFFYIFQINEITKASFFISNYEKQMTELSQNSKSLEINFSQVNSLANLEALVKSLNYEEVDRIHYIRILESAVAAK